MNISVFGLGYVGTVTMACLAETGHTVIGVDPQANKVDLIRSGQSPIIEAEVNDLLAHAIEQGRLSALTDARAAVLGSDLGVVCVGTPSQANGSLDLSYLRRVAEEIGRAIAEHPGFFVVVIRSTVLPGTTKDSLIPLLEASSGRKLGEGFGLCYNPEFLREGSAVQDFRFPPKTVIGANDVRSREIATPVLERPDAPTIQTTVEVAEMVKYADNSWHAVKVAFANEIGSVAKMSGIDGREVMEVFAADEKLNLSAAYLKPGLSFGGSCLPKDVRALVHRGRRLDLDLPLINSVLESNRAHLDRAFDLIVRGPSKRVGVLGLSFKAGTDDLRESPMVEIVERLIGKGYELKIFDPNVNLARLVGANRDYILHQIPHISSLMVGTMSEVLDASDTIVIGTNDSAFADVMSERSSHHRIIDLVRLGKGSSASEEYDGICW